MELIKLTQIYKHIPVFMVVLFAGFFSCTEKITVSTNDAPEHLVIYGYITNDTTVHSIRITRSAGYFSPGVPEGVSDAVVRITSGDKIIELTENRTEPGVYQTEPDVFGEAGKPYLLYVSADVDGDGAAEEFEASDTMPYPAEIDSIGLRQSEAFDDMMEIVLYGKIPDGNEKNYFSFHAYRNDVIVNDSLSGFFILGDEYLEKREFAGLACFFLDQEDDRSMLQPGDRISLHIDLLTEGYAEFLDNAQMQVSGSNPVFSGPPANIQTNIRSIRNTNRIPVVGFFSAFSGQSKTTVYR
jgi:hypothetical protein